MNAELEAAVVELEQARKRRGESEAPIDDVTHDTLALGMGAAWPDARHVAAWGRWFFWRGSRWAEDETLLHMTRCRAFLRELAEHLVDESADQGEKAKRQARRSAETLKNAHTVAQVVGLARSNAVQAAEVDQWDSGRLLVGTPDEGRQT